MRGTRPDGQPHLMRGVVIFGVTCGQASWARLHLEPVEPGDDGIDGAIGSRGSAARRLRRTVTTTGVRDARPPAALVRVLNPLTRGLLCTPLGRVASKLAVIEFSGRRSPRTYRVPVGWHQYDGSPVVFTPARWRMNFAGGAPATVHHRGRSFAMRGLLVEDPEAVAAALASVLTSGTSPGLLGLDLPPGHAVTASDVTSVDRAMIRFSTADGLTGDGRHVLRR